MHSPTYSQNCFSHHPALQLTFCFSSVSPISAPTASLPCDKRIISGLCLSPPFSILYSRYLYSFLYILKKHTHTITTLTVNFTITMRNRLYICRFIYLIYLTTAFTPTRAPSGCGCCFLMQHITNGFPIFHSLLDGFLL